MLVLEFVIGLVAIIKGADWLTDGAASIAHHFGIPTIVVGLTIVAVGSSAPEFVVSVVSAIKGNVDMALGNVVGSNIFNILGIVGITALVMPITIDRRNMKYDVPFVVLSSLFIAITAFDSYFEGNGNPVNNSISRSDGLLMLCTFVVFMAYTMSIAKKDQNNTDDNDNNIKPKPLWKNILLAIIGLVLLVAGGDGLVEGASGIARWIGISESVIALTIVSAGTSAPELAASVMAAKKGDTAMALGNVVGSVVFNVFFVLGTSAVIFPLGIGGVTATDILALLGASVLLWILTAFGQKTLIITRTEGAILVIMAIAYYTYLVI
ncbi:MAG: calcium/sodium antiporter [Prevotella sp.]|nr:calcium/sodium antiporter [Prevotella sp.]MBR4521916.1 calcium/sodium antiporter [Prevotella sp.]